MNGPLWSRDTMHHTLNFVRINSDDGSGGQMLVSSESAARLPQRKSECNSTYEAAMTGAPSTPAQ
jgi:hypothetical protein